MRRADGSVEQVGAAGQLLGLRPDVALARALETATHETAVDALEHIHAAVREQHAFQQDDIALLLVSVQPRSSG